MGKSYEGVVQKVIPHGRHGPYAVAITDNGLNVTFALQVPTWSEESHPEQGTVVILEDVIKKRSGWRAKSARFVRPTDEEQQSARSNENESGQRA